MSADRRKTCSGTGNHGWYQKQLVAKVSARKNNYQHLKTAYRLQLRMATRRDFRWRGDRHFSLSRHFHFANRGQVLNPLKRRTSGPQASRAQCIHIRELRDILEKVRGQKYLVAL